MSNEVKSYTIDNLTQREVQMIHAALAICAPSGGGSDVFHLANRVLHDTNVDPDHALEMSYSSTVVTEWAGFVGLDLSAVGSNVGNYIHKK